MLGRVRSQLKECCLDSGIVPSGLSKERTALLQNDKSKGNIASNYRPMAYLPLIWKLLMGVIPEEQKGCRKKSRGTNDLLFIDRAVSRKVKSRKKNLAMAWIGYKKANGMVPHL